MQTGLKQETEFVLHKNAAAKAFHMLQIDTGISDEPEKLTLAFDDL